MGDSIRLQIVNAVETALNQASVTTPSGTITKPSGLTVHRFRTRPTERDDLPAQVVYITARPKPVDSATDLVDKVLHVAVESRVEVPAPNTTPPDDELDPLVSWAHIALLEDETLGGLISGPIEEGESHWDAAEANRVFAGNRTVYEIHYQTRRNDPELTT